LLLFLLGLACLFPICIYVLFLALLHQRRHPTLLPGSWDFVGVLLALSGFLIFGTTIFLLSFQPAGREFLLHGGTPADVRRISAQGSPLIVLLWFLFYASLACSFAFMIWQRRAFSVIYNLTPAEMEQVLQGVIDRLHLQAIRRGRRWYIGSPERMERNPAGGDSASQHISATEPRWALAKSEPQVIPQAVLDVHGSPLMRTVTILWRSYRRDVRQELQAELERELDQFPSSAGATAGWMITLASALFVLIIVTVGAFLALVLWR
jgi:hypothetical protein